MVKPTITPAPADDPKTILSEQILNHVLQNQSQELYALMSEKVKAQVKPEMLENLLTQIESQAGKYQSHEPWEIHEAMGMKAYTSLLNFENISLGMVIVYDNDGKMMGLNFSPVATMNKQ